MKNGTSACSCQSSFDCAYPAGIYDLPAIKALNDSGLLQTAVSPNITLPGIFAGCFPLNALLRSTLECLFSTSCLAALQSSIFDRHPLAVDTLVYSGTSRFPPNTTVQLIVDQILIETWVGIGNYSALYSQCQPNLCTYSYESSASFVMVLTTIIALFGGLSVVMKTVAPLITMMYQRFTKTQQSTQTSVDHDTLRTDHRTYFS